MCLVKVMQRFPDEVSCFRFLEDIRYKNGAFGPYCSSTHIARKAGELTRGTLELP